MDFSRYQPQASSSHYPNQGQQDAGTSRAVVPIDNNAVQQYITRLYHNPTLGIAPPTQDPAFFEKSQQDMISVKHKLEQMMLINQQQAELARLNTQRSYGQQQAIASSSNVNAQAYQNAQAVNPAPQHHAGWTNAASGTWVQPQQVYIPPAQPAHSVAQTYTVHYPEVEMRDVPYVAQPSAQVVQIDTPPQKSAHYRPHTYNQPQEAPWPTQQRVNPAPVPQQTRVYRPQPQQAAPVQVANLNPTPGMFRPYPQHAPEAQRHPLQPSSQVGSPTVQQGQQVANMQKQMNYLQRLEQQHQRPPVQQPQASSSRALPVSQQVVVPMPAVARAANVTAHAQPVAPQPVVNKPPTPEAPVPSVEEVPPIPTASQESSGSTAGSATPNPSPPKPRSRRPFSLQDLRSERRRSNGRSSGTPSELRQVIAAPSATAPEATSASQATPAGSGGTRPPTPRLHVQANTPPAAMHPPEQSLLFSAPANATTVAMDSRTSTQEDAFTSAQTSSSTPLASANSLPAASIETVDPVPVPTATPDQAAIQIELPTPSSAPPIVSPLPNASAPALNNPVPVQTGVTAHLGPRPAAPAPSALRPRPSSTGPMKMALEVLHQKGADCVALVRKAAQMSGASVDHLQVPSAGIGETRARAVPLFAPGQPLEIWSQKIQVSKELGEAIVHNIWALAKEKAIELGLDVKALKCSPAPTTLDAGSQRSADKPSIYGNSNTPVASGTPVDDLPAAPSLNQPSAPVPAQTAPALPTEPMSMQTSRNDPAQPTQQPPPALVAPNPAPTAPAVQQTAPALSTAPAPAPSAPPRMDVFRPTQFVQYQPAQASPTQSQVTNSTTNAPAPQGTNPLPSLARWGNYDPFPNGRPSPRTQPQPQLPPAAQSPAYVPPTLDFQPAPAPAPAPQPPAPISAPTPPPAKPKTKNTAALAYLRAIGAFRDEEPPVVVNGSGNKAGESDVVETSKKKDKGKGKATDVEIPMETEPASEPEPQAVPVEEAFDEEVIVDDTPTPPASVVVEESRASEPPQIPQDPIPRPDSPAAPEIAVLPEPVSAEPTRPSTPIAVTPTFVATPTPGPAPSSVAPILDMPMPDFAPSPTARIFPDPAPIPASVQAPVSPPRLPTPPPAIATPQPIVEPRVDASTPASTTSAIAEPPSAGYAPLKRKRKPADPATSANIPAPYPPTNTSWAAIYSNAHNSAHQVKRPRTTEPTSSKNKLTSKPTEPLFRPETPSADEDDEPAIIPTRRPKKLKRKRMIMEVVIPIRKDKGKAVAVLPSAVQSMIDLTLEDTDEELAQIVDEGSSDEEDSNLRMLRRRLRPHQCEWVGCVGSPILASAELLGIHLCKMHLRTRDPLTGHYMCRWDECKLKFKTSKRLWKHISEAHVVRPWYCPYQGCNRTASEKHRMGVHINRSHKEDSGSELRPLARPTEFLPEQVVLRPSAFPPGVPYFRIMSMALRYEVVPARISAARHSRIEPIILRNISARAELVDVPLPVEASPDRTRVPEPPAPIRSPLRLSTLPPEGLAEELEREAGPPPMSPIRSQLSPGKTKGRAISVHSDDSTPEPPPRSERVYRARGRGRGRGRGQIVRSVQHEASSSSSAAPRLQMVVELPSRK